MRILLATLCLNEMEHLPHLYAQHRDWPGLLSWVFVEAADKIYANTNPDLVNSQGLSVDGTSEWLSNLGDRDPRVHYIPHGFSTHQQNDQGKVQARQRYMEIAERVKPDFIIVVDADEFYCQRAQSRITKRFERATTSDSSFVFKQRHLWLPPSISNSQPLFTQEVVGGYWRVPHVRGWKWEPGLCYKSNHNWLEDSSGTILIKREPIVRCDKEAGAPECIHLGYASSGVNRLAKHNYYITRGEGQESNPVLRRQRSMYVDCRAAWQTWQPGDTLPHGAQVISYTGEIPEVFRHEQSMSAL